MSDQAYPDALPSQYRLHWYVLDRVLGQGGFGITYLARDTNLDQAVAIKEYLPVEVATRRADSTVRPRSDDQGDRYRWGLDRFLREARTLARFDHPNIVRVLSVFEFNGTAYMVMRFEEGENFATLLERRRTLPEAELMRVLLPILDGLELIHNAGFIHRDIKPDNLHIRVDGTPVLLDFGSARGSLGQGRTVTILVAPGYAPFEQYYSSGENQGAWTDLYGLGATCYRAIAGVPPLDAITRSKGVLGSAREVLIPARTIGAGRYSERVLRAIDHALEFAEKDRPQSIAEWRRELQGAVEPPVGVAAVSPVEPLSPAPPPAQTLPPSTPTVRQSPNRLAVAAGLALVAALAGAFGAYFVLQNSKPSAPPVAAAPSPAPPPAASVPPPATTPEQKPAPPLQPEAKKEPDASPPIAAAPREAPAPARPAPPAKPAIRETRKEKPVKPTPPAEKPAEETPAPAPRPPDQLAIAPPDTPKLNPPTGDEAAFKYYQQHANRGHAGAMLKVAEYYEAGRGTTQNDLWACSWYALAARRGIEAAKTRKNTLAKKLQPRELLQCQSWADGQSARDG
ncbi:MAG TPA: protein kinase [Burkholderiales bacterium]|nr:protein kinase [Burkholderiales bacterium]